MRRTSPYTLVYLLPLLLSVLSGILPSAIAQSDAPPRAKVENRFLFIVNTSSAMKPLNQAGQKAVLDLLKSGMEGQLRDGDTIGIWTYNDDIYSNFPMQIWSETEKQTIINSAASFLSEQKLSKKARLDRVLPSMFSIIKSSRTLTVVLISDGNEEIQGTSFDKEIRDLHDENRREFRKAGLPFVTILVARNGVVIDYALNSLDETIRVPKTAEPALVPKPAELVNKTDVAPTAETNKPVAVTVAKPPVVKVQEVRRIEIGSPLPRQTNVPAAVPVQAALGADTLTNLGPVASAERSNAVAAVAAPAPMAPSTLSGASQPPQTQPNSSNSPTAVAARSTPELAAAPEAAQASVDVFKPEAKAPPMATKANKGSRLLIFTSLLSFVIVSIIFGMVRHQSRGSTPSLISQSMRTRDK